MHTGCVFNIQKFSINDGPGIRTTVFLKGCPLRCVWCHNAESHLSKKEIAYSLSKCIGCGRCIDVCENNAHRVSDGVHIFDREKCIVCGKCAEACPAESLELMGEDRTVEEVLAEVMKDKAFYDNSEGGMTVSGGEPLVQFEFTYELLKKAKELGLHTCIETCGYAPEEKILKVSEYVDIFLYDWKISDSKMHKDYTGVSNDLIESNLKALDGIGAKIVLRCPIIPEVNDTEEHFSKIAELANTLDNVIEVNVEPYHALGNDKYKRLGKTECQEFKMPENETVEKWILDIQKKTKKTVKKG